MKRHARVLIAPHKRARRFLQPVSQLDFVHLGKRKQGRLLHALAPVDTWAIHDSQLSLGQNWGEDLPDVGIWRRTAGEITKAHIETAQSRHAQMASVLDTQTMPGREAPRDLTLSDIPTGRRVPRY